MILITKYIFKYFFQAIESDANKLVKTPTFGDWLHDSRPQYDDLILSLLYLSLTERFKTHPVSILMVWSCRTVPESSALTPG